jgi:broad specificity phosphatase PhoE
MAVKITYFVHGTTRDNEKGLATGWMPGELSGLGISQTKELGKLVSGKNFDVVFCSDLKRAVDSAKLGFAGRCKIIKDKRLREANYGDYAGKPAKKFKNNLIDYIETKFPNGESYQDIKKRIAGFLEFLKEKYDGKHIAIVAHQAPQLALDVLLKNKT